MLKKLQAQDQLLKQAEAQTKQNTEFAEKIKELSREVQNEKMNSFQSQNLIQQSKMVESQVEQLEQEVKKLQKQLDLKQ